MNFKKLQEAIFKQLSKMAKGELFRTNVSGDRLWEEYLDAFPGDSNPIYKERREYDCNCCKNFVRAAGNAVSVVGNKVVTIWDVKVDEPNFQIVVDRLSDVVRSQYIKGVFARTEPQCGAKKTIQALEEGGTKSWDHFYFNLPSRFVKKTDIGTYLSNKASLIQVFKRGIKEISQETIETVLELIHQNSIYRGEEHREALKKFLMVKKAYDKLTTLGEKDCYIWNEGIKLGGLAKIRNTAIGTLLVDLSKGEELDSAVSKFEKMVAPQNYKRPTALITPMMIKKAEEKVVELGLTSALKRRHSVIGDITINNVLWADRSAKKAMSVFDELKSEVKVDPKAFSKVEEVHINDFMKDVLPTAETIELQVENRHESNFMSLISPEDKSSNNLFKWGNDFSWAYNGSVADSLLRQEVIKRGGKIGVFRFSHSWNHDGNNQSLMDLHVFMPGNTKKFTGKSNDAYGVGNRVGWNQRNDPYSRGTQDVDYTMKAGTTVPVENITFPELNRMPDGVYKCAIHNWHNRPVTSSGFKAEIEFAGEIYQYEYPKALANKEWVHVADVTKEGDNFTIEHKLDTTQSTRNTWGINSNSFHKVNVVMYSPNHWDGEETGNRHHFFMMEDCKNPDKVRGFFNEFLKQDLNEHRKVFEVLGSKLKADFQDDQLSGIGFSSTQRNSVLCRVTGKTSRVIKLVF